MSYLRGNSVVDGNLYVEGTLYVKSARPSTDDDDVLAYIKAKNGDIEGRHLIIDDPSKGSLKNSSIIESIANNNVTISVKPIMNTNANSLTLSYPIDKIEIIDCDLIPDSETPELITEWSYQIPNTGA